MRFAIVGAGAAGLASARHVSKNEYHCDVFEMAPALGGAWVYTDEIEQDKYGFPVYSAMYKGLKTNLPKEIMGFPDFPMPDHPKSYLDQAEVLNFLNLYADHFNLRQYIKFNRMVLDIRQIENGKWQVTTQDKPSRKSFVGVYDAVMICNGHYNEPRMPRFPGQECFKGQQYHSKVYRTPEQYRGKSILVVGAGPSGMDLALQISVEANKVFFSHHSKTLVTKYPPNVIMKPDIRLIKENGVEFTDGSYCCVDVIFYCTGYVYNFPFLHESCGITVEEKYIQPLYKHIINIAKPTMAFIGIPFNVCAFLMFDLQARFFVNSINGTMKLPSTYAMMEDTESDLQDRRSKGYTKQQTHMMGPYQQSYYDDLATLAKTYHIPKVIVKIREHSDQRFDADLINFRNDKYTILDESNFLHAH